MDLNSISSIKENEVSGANLFSIVSSLEAWAAERRIVKSLSLSSLKGCTLGISVSHYIDLLYNVRPEPLVPAVGGFPLAVKDLIDHDLAALKAQNITPVFVFDGLSLAITSVDKPFTGASQSAESAVTEQRRQQAWEVYNTGNAENAVRQFDEVASFDLRQQQVKTNLIKYFIEQEVSYLVAPYTASAQLVYLQNEGYIDTIYGPLDVLMYPAVEKVITQIDFKASMFSWIPKSQILYEMALSHEQFVEACILLGCQVSPKVYPVIQQQVNNLGAQGHPTSALRFVLPIVQSSPTAAAVAGFVDPEQPAVNFLERFQKAYSAIQYQPAVKESGKVEPVTPEEDTPSDIHEFIGQRLPDELYFYVYNGLVNTELLDVLTSGYFVEVAPLDGGLNTQYRRFVQHLHSNIYPKILSLLSQTLHRFYQYKPIKSVMWFEPNRERPFNKVTQPVYYQVSSWKVHDDTLAKNIKSYSVRDFLTPFYGESPKDQEQVSEFAASTVFKKPEGTAQAPLLSTGREIISNSVLRALHILGFFTNDHQLTPWGQVVAKTLKSVSKEYQNDAIFAEAVVLALLLLKDGFLTSANLEPPISGGPDNGSPETKTHALLLSRVATFISLRHRPTGFVGPLSHTLLAFQSIISKEISAVRGLVECSMISLLANAEVNRQAVDEDVWKNLARDTPFSHVPNTGGGIAMKSYLDKINTTPTGPATSQGDTITAAQNELVSMFKQAVDVSDDLSKAFKLWDSVVAGVKEAQALGLVTASVAGPFQAADAWVKPYVIQK